MEKNKKSFNLNKINRLKINIASSEKIQNWAKREQVLEFEISTFRSNTKYKRKQTFFGEVTSPLFFRKTPKLIEFHNEGLFSEVIFGPIFNFKCLCYRINQKIMLFRDCNVCNVSLTLNTIRDYRMGYIPLAAPVFNPLFLSSNFNLLKIFFGTQENVLRELIYLTVPKENQFYYFKKLNDLLKIMNSAIRASHGQVQHVDETGEIDRKLTRFSFSLNSILDNKNIQSSLKKYLFLFRKSENGVDLSHYFSETIFDFFKKFDILKELRFINKEFNNLKITSSFYTTISRKLRLLENFYKTKTNISSIMFKAFPVTPPNFRPFDPEDIDGSTSSKMNYLYQNILTINEKLRYINLLDIDNKKFLLANEIKSLQETVDFLINNQKLNKNQSVSDRPTPSLVDVIRGKEGRFRKSILGKRINFSARTVIVVNPLLNITHCGIPFKILKNLLSFKVTKILNKLKPVVLSKVKNFDSIYLEILKKLIKHEIVMLNRAPTLHKLGIQAFNIVMTMTDAIQLHPLVCAAYNADFDGDQMAIYLPLTKISQVELNLILKSTKDLFVFGNSSLKMKPTQELILGLNYLGQQNYLLKSFGFGNYFNDYNEFFSSFMQKKLKLSDPIWFKSNLLKNNQFQTYSLQKDYVRITPGQLIINKILSEKTI
jgi:DNA-directed RNA polymerase, beta'' subunit/160 kD subunit